MSYEIDSIVFSEDMVVISFMEMPGDVRVGGSVVRQQRVSLSTDHPDYGEDASLLEGMAQKMLRNAMGDFAESPPYVPESGEDDDDERGMGQ